MTIDRKVAQDDF